MFNKEGIMDFEDIKNKSKDIQEETKSHDRSRPSVSEEEMKGKIMTARVHANKEIQKFKKITEEYLQEVDNLCLFREITPLLQEYLIVYMTEMNVEPMIKGKEVPGLDDNLYNKFRKEMYRALIREYIEDD